MKYLRSIVVLFLICTISGSLFAQLKLPALIANHMVLQQESNAPLWGWDTPGKTISITPSWIQDSYSGKADHTGKWMISVQTPAAGGPYSLKISGSETITISDVLIGEVWLCSGQSNMEMPLKGWANQPITGSERYIAEANYPNMRLFTVQRKVAYQPEVDCIGEWAATTPETAADFSAAGYFFGLHLFKQLNIPIGLIHSSWGGTPAESWTSKEYIEKIPYFSKGGDFDAVEYRDKKVKSFEGKQKAWLKELGFQAEEGIPGWALADFNADDWDDIQVPGNWEDTEAGHFEGVMDLRIEVNLPGSWRKKATILDLGPIDEMDLAYVNGVLVGKHLNVYDWPTFRSYEIPAGILKKGKNVIAVKVANTSGLGGINGVADKMRVYPKGKNSSGESLAGVWKYRKASTFGELSAMPNCVNCSEPQIPTTLYNGMIAPLLPFRIKGAIWYQGESNRYDGKLYGKIFPNMITNWREDWAQGDFPFYFVQIAPYSYRDDFSTGLLREAQTNSMSLPHTGMVVTMDIGSLSTIHPPDKKTVGIRLATWALVKDYGFENVQYSGPVYKAWKKEDDKIRVFFNMTCGGLRAEGGPLRHFMIAGADMKFVPAIAEIDKNTVVVYSPDVPNPVAVRFGWDHTDQTNLFNMAGLPAGPFRTDTD